MCPFLITLSTFHPPPNSFHASQLHLLKCSSIYSHRVIFKSECSIDFSHLCDVPPDSVSGFLIPKQACMCADGVSLASHETVFPVNGGGCERVTRHTHQLSPPTPLGKWTFYTYAQQQPRHSGFSRSKLNFEWIHPSLWKCVVMSSNQKIDDYVILRGCFCVPLLSSAHWSIN